MNGANGDWHSYHSIVTSYDGDAPLSEAGDMTWKWQSERKTIAKHVPDIPTYKVSNSTKNSYGKVKISESVTF
jgi:beta-galactosidase